MYKKANKQKLRFATNVGSLTAEQLWDLPVTDLDTLAISLQQEYKDSGKKSFLVKTTTKDKTTKLRFDIVVDVLNTKVEDMEALRDSKDIKEHNDKINRYISDKKEEGLQGKSIEELEALLK